MTTKKELREQVLKLKEELQETEIVLADTRADLMPLALAYNNAKFRVESLQNHLWSLEDRIREKERGLKA